MPLPKIGQFAPNFSLPDQHGIDHTLSQYRGSWIVLYFYPKDDTPGCTTEACQMRDLLPDFSKVKAVVLGISVDSVSKHAKFAAKFNLTFPLLSDEHKTVVEQYGVWGEKKFMGKKYMGIIRTTLLIDPAGKVIKLYEHVNPNGHAEVVMKDLNSLLAY